MGSPLAHAAAGSYTLIFGLWWTISQFRRFHLSRVTNGSPYHNSPTFKAFFLPRCLANWECEGLLKIFIFTIAILTELLKPGHPLPYNAINGQHITMYSFFIVNGITDILMHHKVPLPKSINYMSLVLANFQVGMLFVFHVYGLGGIDTNLHLLAAFSMILIALATIVEMNFPKSITAGLGRSYFTLLSGTWLWQVSFFFYNPFPGDHVWDENNNSHMMLLHLMFAWHMTVVFIVQLIIGSIVACIYRHHSPTLAKDEYRLLKNRILQNGKCQESMITLPTEDVNSDFE